MTFGLFISTFSGIFLLHHNLGDGVLAVGGELHDVSTSLGSEGVGAVHVGAVDELTVGGVDLGSGLGSNCHGDGAVAGLDLGAQLSCCDVVDACA